MSPHRYTCIIFKQPKHPQCSEMFFWPFVFVNIHDNVLLCDMAYIAKHSSGFCYSVQWEMALIFWLSNVFQNKPIYCVKLSLYALWIKKQTNKHQKGSTWEKKQQVLLKENNLQQGDEIFFFCNSMLQCFISLIQQQFSSINTTNKTQLFMLQRNLENSNYLTILLWPDDLPLQSTDTSINIKYTSPYRKAYQQLYIYI